ANTEIFNSNNLSLALSAGGELTQAYDAVWNMFWQQDYIPAALLELCRLRLAQLHRATAELGVRQIPASAADEARIQSLLTGNWEKNKNFSAGELAALEFTEIYGQDPNALSDENADAIKRYFGETGLVCLIEALGFIDGRIRLGLVFSGIAAASR
ncbi:MAG TPA: hypothetical protein VLC91_14300, partial [Spongiibacteraceae bacterium]|nr:hypothetical protein [Spongiibacteraceae bacterium]